MAETLRDLGVVVDHPEANVYEVASGDVEWLFVPLEAAAKMRASVHAPRAAPEPVRPGDHQQPGRRPDRAAAGRPPRRGDADARRRRSSTATATTSRRRRAGSAAPRSGSRSCRSWAPRTRCSPRRSPTATRSSGRPPQEPEVDDLIAFLQKMGAEVERTYPDTIEVDGRKRLRGAEHHVDPGPDRGRHVRRRRRGDRRPGHAHRRPVRPPRPRSSRSSGGPASRVTCEGDTIEVDGSVARDRRVPGRATSRPRRIRASRRTSSRRRRCC